MVDQKAKDLRSRFCWSMLIGTFLLVAPSNAWAERAVYQAPQGFWLAPSGHRATLYGPTKDDADWNVAQWGIPQDLPSFDAAGATRNSWANAVWLGNGRYKLSQNASTLSCDKLFPSGARLVNEFDFLVAPNNANVPRYPQAIGSHYEQFVNLSRIDARITLNITDVKAVDSVCPVSQTMFIYAVVLTDRVHRQVLYYQLRLAHFTASALGAEASAVTPAWFFIGKNIQSGAAGQWGFGDDITTFGQPWAEIGIPQSYRLDLLPRLRWLIEQGARSDLDQNLAHWELTGTYHGQVTMGHMHNSAVWSQFSLAVN